MCVCVCRCVCACVSVYPRMIPSPHQDSTGTPPQRHTAAGTAAPTTTLTGNTVPQRANPTRRNC